MPLFAQVAGQRLDVPIYRADGSPYTDLGVGGMNNPQFSEVDLNQDGIADLFVFDRTGNVPLTYINNGTPNEVDYHFSPEYAGAFPDSLNHWALLRDYDGDGIMDIFTHSQIPGIAGITVYKGSMGNDDMLSYGLVRNYHNDFDLLSFPGFSGLELEIYVSSADIPSIVDADGDGDLDVITFAQVGSKVEWYRNLSQEMGYGNDSLYFDFHDPCWGLFYESGTSAQLNLSDSPNQCADLNRPASFSPRHAGSATACWDNDGDGHLDMLIGDLSGTALAYVQSNSGATSSTGAPWMDMADAHFPNDDTPVEMSIFPAPFVLDVNNDGKEDILCAPNDAGASNNIQVAWRYNNIADAGSPGQFNYREDDFLVKNGLDFGQGTKPAFFDYNADGLMDIVVGTDGAFTGLGQFDTRLVLLENIGVANAPAYRIVDEDWLGFSQYVDRNLAPAFGDLDGDGDKDLLVGQTNGDLFFIENTGTGATPAFGPIIPEYQSIGGGLKAVPAIYDMNGDGLGDIIVGNRQGWVGYFENTGTVGNPAFTAAVSEAPNIPQFGNVDTRKMFFGVADTRGYCSPKVITVGDRPHLVSGSYFNSISIYDAQTQALTDAFALEAEGYGDITQGQQTAPDLADIDDDGLYEMVVGNHRGGLAFYNTDLSVSAVGVGDLEPSGWRVNIAPNPTNDEVRVVFDNLPAGVQWSMDLFDVSGRRVGGAGNTGTISLGGLPSGVYILHLEAAGATCVERVVKY